ncbi:MAG: hypothetical protein AB7G15_05910 [Alphaproteobacteria bacterium]
MKDWVGKRAQAGRLPQALDPGSPLRFGRGDKKAARERDQFFDKLRV